MTLFPGAKLMQVNEWGYPMGRLRAPIDPALAFSVVHITAIPDATAESEANWRIQDPSLQNSATFFNNRDGSPVQLLGDPVRMAPWSNGDMQSPDLSNPRIAALVRSGLNANQRTLISMENVGNEYEWRRANGTIVPGGFPITPAQEATCARQIAFYHTREGVPINRETVIGHYQLNGVNRQNCPSADKSILDRIVALAQGHASQENDVLNDYFKRAEFVTNRNAMLRAGATGRSIPAFNPQDYDDYAVLPLTHDSSGPAVAWVTGTNLTLSDGTIYDARTRWLATWSNGRGLLFWHERDVAGLTPREPVQTVTVVDQAAIAAALAALNKNLDVWASQRPTK